MKRSIWIFLLAIVLPSIGLGWLALRSANEQQIILERRTAELYQKETDAVASAARGLIEEERRAFADRVRQMLAGESAPQLAHDFAAKLSRAWPRPAIGFALSAEGNLISPSAEEARGDAERQRFVQNNGAFLSGTTPATVYSVPAEELNRPEQKRKQKAEYEDKAAAADAAAERSAATRKQSAAAPAGPSTQTAAPKVESTQSSQMRNVAPQNQLKENAPAVSQLVPATADFKALTSDHPEGVVTRFMQDRLEIVFWLRPPEAPGMIFGCLLSVDALTDLWRNALPDNAAPDYVIALLNDKARPIATQPPGESGRDWKHPFVATEIGEALPHWEATLYLMRPEQLQESARNVRRTLVLLIAAALAAIAFGGWVVFADARRQLALAQKKTDFVSNVSHELKTPLTSIRMFAEMMQGGNVAAEKRPQYLRIIVAEAERLTRLINNVLDFARLERKQKRYDFRPLDLHEVLARTWEGHELHLREQGFTTSWQAAPPPYPVRGDEDALAQIIVNLLSNAEKYSADRKEIELHSYLTGNSVHVSVLDRGSGVPPGEEMKIFEAFYRAHDSLASGIQGSGLGLTLAQRLAKEHGGEITYQAREGGGSNVTLRLPPEDGAVEMKKRLLVVEDDAHIRLGLCEALRAEGYDVIDCRDGAQAGPLVKQQKPDLVILDIMLPGKSGFDLCRELRAAKNRVPILMLSAKGQEIDKVVGLELGADDYVTKPFSLRELIARVQALLRRAQAGGAASDLPMEIAFGKVRIDCKALRGKRGGKAIELTPREMKVLSVLFRERGNAVSREALLNEVWGVDYYGTTRTLDQLIVKLRQKIEEVPGEPRHLLTVHTLGYRLEV